MESGTDLRTIQLLMGHAHLEHTPRYLHMSQRHLHAAPNPLDQISVHRHAFYDSGRTTVFNVYLDRHPHPILLIDTRARLYANAAAKNIASLNDGLSIVSGRISLTSTEEQLAFTKAASEAASRDSGSVRWLQVTRATDGRPYHLLLMPVPSNGHSDAELGNAPEAGVLVALIVNHELGPEPDPAILCVLFSLTQTEARVAAKLATGLSAKEIAAEMRVLSKPCAPTSDVSCRRHQPAAKTN